MCFSAPASFLASGALAGIGSASLRRARDTSLKWYAAMPLLFAVQQAIEGLQWLVQKPSPQSAWLGYAYLFFAYVLWPFYFPFAVHAMERNPRNRALLRWFIFFGSVGSLYLLINLFVQDMSIVVTHRRLEYFVGVPLRVPGVILYVIATCGPALASSRPRVRIFGAAVFVAFLVSIVSFQYAFTSVSCFLAAVLSALVYWEVRGDMKKATAT